MNERWELFTLQWFLFKTDIGVNNDVPYSFEAKVHILTILQNINICDSQYGDSFLSNPSPKPCPPRPNPNPKPKEVKNPKSNWDWGDTKIP